MKHLRVAAGAARHVCDSSRIGLLEEPAKKGRFIGEALRPVDDRFIQVGQIVKGVLAHRIAWFKCTVTSISLSSSAATA
jgi:hypothetical protein